MSGPILMMALTVFYALHAAKQLDKTFSFFERKENVSPSVRTAILAVVKFKLLLVGCFCSNHSAFYLRIRQLMWASGASLFMCMHNYQRVVAYVR